MSRQEKKINDQSDLVGINKIGIHHTPLTNSAKVIRKSVQDLHQPMANYGFETPRGSKSVKHYSSKALSTEKSYEYDPNLYNPILNPLPYNVQNPYIIKKYIDGDYNPKLRKHNVFAAAAGNHIYNTRFWGKLIYLCFNVCVIWVFYVSINSKNLLTNLKNYWYY